MINKSAQPTYAPHTRENKDIEHRERTKNGTNSITPRRVERGSRKTAMHIPLTGSGMFEKPSKGRLKDLTIKSTAKSIEARIVELKAKTLKGIEGVKALVGRDSKLHIEAAHQEFSRQLDHGFGRLLSTIDQNGKIEYEEYGAFIESQNAAFQALEEGLWESLESNGDLSSKAERKAERAIGDLAHQMEKELSSLEAA